MKIYTRAGDSGETGLFGGPRVRKDSLRIEAYGTVDELNAVLGFARAESLPPEIDNLLARVQSELFDFGAELSSPEPQRHGTVPFSPAHVADLRQEIDRSEEKVSRRKHYTRLDG